MKVSTKNKRDSDIFPIFYNIGLGLRLIMYKHGQKVLLYKLVGESNVLKTKARFVIAIIASMFIILVDNNSKKESTVFVSYCSVASYLLSIFSSLQDKKASCFIVDNCYYLQVTVALFYSFFY